MKKLIKSFIALLVVSSSVLSAENNPYQEIQWEALIPASDLEALINAPMGDGSTPEDGAADDVLNSPLDNSTPPSNPKDAFQKALRSSNTVAEYDGRRIRLPGFMVPLEFNDQQQVTVFFLVPYFGACIHLPPPPPNQIVYVKYPEGLTQDDLQTPYWIEGEIKTDLVQNDFTKAAYTITAEHIEVYTE